MKQSNTTSRYGWLIGAGPMAVRYAAVLADLDVSYDVIGRGAASAQRFADATGVQPYVGGVELAQRTRSVPDFAIVAVAVSSLSSVARELIALNVPSILIEKPGALELRELCAIHDEAEQRSSSVYVAYNRRFYAAVREAQRLVKQDGGVISMSFEFTELPKVLANLPPDRKVREKWFVANSSHVADLAFYLGGRPTNWGAWHAGGSADHPSATRFGGAGVTDRGAVFSYLANWDSPGRWGVEIQTSARRLVLRPLEKLQEFDQKSMQLVPITIDDVADTGFKPGLFAQTQAFLAGRRSELCSIEDQIAQFPVFESMANYT